MNFFGLLLSLPFALILIWHSAGLQLAGIHAAVRAKAHAVQKGTWGGEGVILEVTHNGAEVEFDCAHGQISQPMTFDRKGNFDWAGTFTLEHGGPVLNNETGNADKAHYTGHIEGKVMTLTVVLEKEKVGPFTLTYDARPNLRKCR